MKKHKCKEFIDRFPKNYPNVDFIMIVFGPITFIIRKSGETFWGKVESTTSVMCNVRSDKFDIEYFFGNLIGPHYTFHKCKASLVLAVFKTAEMVALSQMK